MLTAGQLQHNGSSNDGLLTMMKQPAENTNATAEEIQATLQRTAPPSQNSTAIREEIAKLAYDYWSNGLGSSPEEDWLRAEKVIQSRLKGGLTA